MTTLSGEELSVQIGDNLPYLRRYARALTGTQESGDTYAVTTLEVILAQPDQYNPSQGAKVALFGAFHAIWTSSGATIQAPEDGSDMLAKASAHLAKLTPNTREALLLHTVEEFSVSQVGEVMSISADEASQLIEIAYSEMAQHTLGRVMIIEDEAIISMDLEALVGEMGHQVTGIARTETEALALASQAPPDLILSDIQLADNSSGTDAVNQIFSTHGERPVIFITAFPERLLTGEGPEPAFLISKPYTQEQVKSAVSQAMFFSSTETLKV